MTINSGTMTSESRKKMKGRGKERRTIILEAMRDSNSFGALESDTVAEVENKYWKHICDISVDKDHPDRQMFAKVISDKVAPNFKPSLERVKFDLDTTKSSSEQSEQILKAIASGEVPADVGKMLIEAIASIVKIDEYTELKDRIDNLEGVLNGE